jgi:excisionase family DNA binding protein
MTAPLTSPVTAALVAAVIADPTALDELAAALAPRLTATQPAPNGALTTSQAAMHVGVHERTVRRALAAGTLSGHTVAGRWRIAPADLATWIAAGARTSQAPTHTAGRGRGSTTVAGVAAIAGRSQAA